MKNLFYLFIFTLCTGQKLLIPMDLTQNDHLKSYGITFFSLENNINVEWLLNYRGGSFLIDANESIITECKLRGVTFNFVSPEKLLSIYSEIDQNNVCLLYTSPSPRD